MPSLASRRDGVALRQEASRCYSRAGENRWPGAIGFQSDHRCWQAFVRDSIVEPAIGSDVLAIELVQRPALLRQLFALAIDHPAQVVHDMARRNGSGN